MTTTTNREQLRIQAICEARKIATEESEIGAQDFLTAFDVAMTGAGLDYVGRPCECPIDEDGTHLPECGWDYAA